MKKDEGSENLHIFKLASSDTKCLNPVSSFIIPTTNETIWDLLFAVPMMHGDHWLESWTNGPTWAKLQPRKHMDLC